MGEKKKNVGDKKFLGGRKVTQSSLQTNPISHIM